LSWKIKGGGYAVDHAWSYNANTATYTDETSDINDNIASDVQAPPIQTITEGDALYIGRSKVFNQVLIQTGTLGSYSGISIVWEYWNGLAWTTLPGISDGTNGFTKLVGTVSWGIPSDWVKYSVNGKNYYWVRARAVFGAAPSIITSPLVTKATLYTEIVLPRNPRKATVKFTAVRKSIPMPGDFALVISHGKQPKVLTITGLLAEKGKRLTELEILYLKPLSDFIYEQVVISAPDTRYDGGYIMTSFVYDETGGAPSSVRYKMEFYMGSEHIVL